MSEFKILTCMSKQKKCSCFVLLFLIFTVNCEQQANRLSNFAQSRSISGSKIGNSVDMSMDHDFEGRDANSETIGLASPKYRSSLRAPSVKSAVPSAYYEKYEYEQQIPSSTASPVYASSRLPQHLQYFNGYYDYYPNYPESPFSRRQLRNAHIPDYVSDLYSYGGAPLYNSLIAIENERDLMASGSGTSFGYGAGGGGRGPGGELLASASGYGDHDDHHGWKGWKKGKKYTSYTDYKVSAVNTDGIGLLGLLGLLSLFQFALLALTTTTTTTTTTTVAPAPGRKKRSAPAFDGDIDETTEVGQLLAKRMVAPGSPDIDSISQTVLPSLNVVAHARNGKIPLNCTYQEVCRTNQLIVNNIEMGGTIIGMKITDGIIDMLQFLDKSPDKALSKQLKDASFKGRMGESCEKHYPTCHELNKPGGLYSLPLLLPLSHPYYYNHAQQVKLLKGLPKAKKKQ